MTKHKLLSLALAFVMVGNAMPVNAMDTENDPTVNSETTETNDVESSDTKKDDSINDGSSDNIEEEAIPSDELMEVASQQLDAVLTAQESEGEDPNALMLGKTGIYWKTASNGTYTIDENKLEITPSKNSPINTSDLRATNSPSVMATVIFQYGGKEKIEPGKAEIRLPAHIFKDRDGNAVGITEVALPLAPNTNTTTSFNYRIEGDEIVISNFEPIKDGGFYLSVDVVYHYEAMDVANDFTNNDIKADFSIALSDEEKLEKTTDSLSVTSKSQIKDGSAEKEFSGKYEQWNMNWGVEPEDAKDYFYIEWEMSQSMTGSSTTEPFTAYFEEDSAQFPEGAEVVCWKDNLETEYTFGTSEEMKDTPVAVVNSYSDMFNSKKYSMSFSNPIYKRNVVIRYPRTLLNDGASPKIENKVTVTIKPKDSTINPIIHFASAVYNYQYVNTEVVYGDALTLYKLADQTAVNTTSSTSKNKNIAGGLSALRNKTDVSASWRISVKNFGYSQANNGTETYDTILRDGMMYIKGVRLEPGDYDYVSFSPIADNSYVLKCDANNGCSYDKSENISQDYENPDIYMPIEVYVRKGNDSEWKKYGELTNAIINSTRYYKWTDVNGQSQQIDTKDSIVNKQLSLPEGTKDIKFVQAGKQYGTEMVMGLTYKLHPTEHVLKAIGEAEQQFSLININEAWAEKDGANYLSNGIVLSGNTTKSIVDDVKKSDAADGTDYEKLGHDYSTHTFTMVNPKSAFTKSIGKIENDSVKKTLMLPVTLTWDYYFKYEILGISFEEAVAMNAINESREAVFYDLLPPGVTIDTSSIKVTPYSKNNCDGKMLEKIDHTVELVENWRDSGRTMVIIHAEVPEDFRNFAKSETYVDTGYKVYFDTYDSYDNIQIYGSSNIKNEAAYFCMDGSVPNGVSDNASVTVIEDENKKYFNHLNAAGENSGLENNVRYSSVTKSYTLPLSTQSGFSKFVKGAADLVYSKSATVPATGEYSYQLRFGMKDDGSSARDVVLYDPLETAFGTNRYWKGIFKGVDISSIVATFPEVNPVVYYSTANFDNVSMNDNKGMVDLTNQTYWSTTAPSDLSTVTAIAVDLSKKKNGTDMIFAGDLTIAAKVYMEAVADYENYMDNPNTPQDETTYAYNKAFVSKNGDLVQSDVVKVNLKEPAIEIEKKSNPTSGTAEYPSIVKAECPLNYDIPVHNGNKAEALRNVTVEDVIPDGLIFKEADLYYMVNENKRQLPIAGDSRIHASVNGQKIVFTIDTLAANETIHLCVPTSISPLANNGMRFENTAEITGFNGHPFEFTSNTTYHKSEVQTKNVKVKKIWDDKNNENNLREPVTIRLYKDNVKTEQTVELSTANSWVSYFKDLPVFEADGVTQINYSVKEETKLASYSTVTYGVDSSDHALTVTNKADIEERHNVVTVPLKKLRGDSDVPVAGAVFEVRLGNQLIQKVTTDASGEGTITIQPSGSGVENYTITEVSAPHGYTVSTTPWNLMLTRSARPVITTENGKIIRTWTWSVNASRDFVNGVLTIENEYHPDPVTLKIPVKKTITGNDRPSEKQFTFTIDTDEVKTPMPERSGRIVSITGEGNGEFGEITYTAAGTYTYEVNEEAKNYAGYTFAQQRIVSVTVGDHNGVLTVDAYKIDNVDALSNKAVEMVNNYQPQSVKVDVPIEKIIEGVTPAVAKTFRFKITNTATKEEEVVSIVGEDVKVTEKTFNAAGTYIYTVEEINDNLAGYTYDTKQYTVTVVVTDNEGVLSAVLSSTIGTVASRTMNLVFTNKYEPTQVEVSLEMEKHFTSDSDQWTKSKTFTFRITPENQLIPKADPTEPSLTYEATDTKDIQKNVSSKLTFTKPGTYKYAITEVNPAASNEAAYGYSYAVVNDGTQSYASSYSLKVVVEDDGNGTLSAKTYLNDTEVTDPKAVFVNRFKFREKDIVLTVKKAFTDDSEPRPNDQQFDFVLTLTPMDDGKNPPMPETTTVSVNGAGVVSFPKIVLKDAGTYRYRIDEGTVNAEGYAGYQDKSWYEIVITTTGETVDGEDTGLLAANMIIKKHSDNGKEETVDQIMFVNGYHPTKTTLEVPVKKIITGQERPENGKKDFTFKMTSLTTGAPMPKTDDVEKDSVTIKDEGVSKFAPITFTSAGTYYYVVEELAGDDIHYNYDRTAYVVKVVVEDDHGKLKATWYLNGSGEKADADTKICFTNNYTPTPTYLALPVEKTVRGDPRPLNYLENFTFEITSEEDAPLPSPSTMVITDRNTDTPIAVRFNPITFTTAGTYNYKIRESSDAPAGFTKDETVHEIQVVVTDNAGMLEAAWSLDGIPATDDTKAAFTNTYKPKETTVSLPVTKNFTEDSKVRPTAETFTFRLTSDSGIQMEEEGGDVVQLTPAAGENTERATGTFGAVHFERAGEYHFEVTEDTASLKTGYSAKTPVEQFKVVVTDIGGALKAVVEADLDHCDHAVITNIYKPQTTSFVLPVRKVFSDNSQTRPVEQSFSFTIEGIDGAPESEDPNVELHFDAGERTDEEIGSFGQITFERAGTYRYEISEIDDGMTGYTYADEQYLTVEVEDQNGTLVVTSAKLDGEEILANPDSVFENTYAPKPLEEIFKVKKKFTEKTYRPEEKTFCFDLSDEEGNLLETISVVGEGEATFAPIELTSVGTYTYYIQEQDGQEPGYTYSNEKHKLVVTVVDDEGILEAKTVIDETPDLLIVTIVNTYQPKEVAYRIPVTKMIVGDAPEEDEIFEFVLTPVEEAPMPEQNTIRIEGAGSDSFVPVTYEKVGNYRYELREVKGENDDYTYDETVHELMVKVSDRGGYLEATLSVDGKEMQNAEFTNTYHKPIPNKLVVSDTGDPLNLKVWTGILIVSLACVIASIVFYRRNK